MRVALIHDHITQYGGAERVFYFLSRAFPDSPIYTIVSDPKITKSIFPKKKIIHSKLQSIPMGIKKYDWFMPYMPYWFEQFDLTKFDVVISSSSVFSKGVITHPQTTHICYCHTPPRFLWHYSKDYIDNISKSGSLRRLLPKSILKHILKNIRMWDYFSAQRVDHFIANSNHVKKRIYKYYRKSADVIYPPVETNRFYTKNKSDYYLVGGRLVPHKRFDIALDAFRSLRNKKLIVFGTGPEEKRIKKIINKSDNIKFLGNISEKKKIELFSKAKAFLYPQEEDFGITAIESLASGTPVIALNKGGATETIEHGVTGYIYTNGTTKKLVNAIKEFEKIHFDPAILQREAQKYNVDRFIREIKSFVKNRLDNKNKFA